MHAARARLEVPECAQTGKKWSDAAEAPETLDGVSGGGVLRWQGRRVCEDEWRVDFALGDELGGGAAAGFLLGGDCEDGAC